MPEDLRRLDGRRFEVRLRFGCRGPATNLSEAIFGWSFDSEDRTLRVRATPTLSTGNAVVQQLAGEEFEAVEGFWIPRPWLLEPVCPAAAAVSPAPTESAPEEDGEQGTQPEAGTERGAGAPTRTQNRPSEAQPVTDPQETRSPPPAWPKVGIAHFFRSTDTRLRRRGMQPYQTVKTLAEDTPVGSQGFNLVLSGRLRALPDRGVIACVNRGAEAPPDCVISADLDRVRIEKPENREVLAEWGSG